MARVIRSRVLKLFEHDEGVYVAPGRGFKGKRQASAHPILLNQFNSRQALSPETE